MAGTARAGARSFILVFHGSGEGPSDWAIGSGELDWKWSSEDMNRRVDVMLASLVQLLETSLRQHCTRSMGGSGSFLKSLHRRQCEVGQSFTHSPGEKETELKRASSVVLNHRIWPELFLCV